MYEPCDLEYDWIWLYVTLVLVWWYWRSSMSSFCVFLCVGVCVCVFNVSSYRCVCVVWAGRGLYSWGILRLMRGPRASFSLLKFLSSSLWYSLWSCPIRALFFLRASSHLQEKEQWSWDLFLLVTQQSVSGLWSVSSPLSEVFKAEAQFVVMPKQLWVIRNVGEKDLRHLKGALWGGETVTYLLRNVCHCFKHWPRLSAPLGCD